MANYFDENQDLRFYIEKGIDWEQLIRLTEEEYQLKDGFRNSKDALTFYKEILSAVGQFSAEQVAPRAREIDRQGAQWCDQKVSLPQAMQDIFKGLQELEVHGMCLPRELGGLNVPLLVYMINGELVSRGDVSTMAHHSFHGGIAMALLVYSIGEGSTTFSTNPVAIKSTRFSSAIDEIARGEAWGSMDITEPDAGSDMSQIKTKAVCNQKGEWRLNGQKIFITSGHGKYHLVIAKTEEDKSTDAMQGLKNLSLFLVPATLEDQDESKANIFIEGLEDKLGHHGSATVTLGFRDSLGYLIGKRGEGFKLMLTMMNNARIAVGFESLGLCEAAYRMAKSYAEQRPSMGKMIVHHEMIADYLDEMKINIQAIRALAMTSAFHEEMYQKLKIKLASHKLDEKSAKAMTSEIQTHQAQSRALTPLLKYFAAEQAVEIARRNLQIHGGSGYTKDYDAERLLRDALVFPIYEGTSQIQALMATKDLLMSTLKDPTGFAKRLTAAKTQALAARDPLKRRLAAIRGLQLSAIKYLITQIALRKLKGIRGIPMSDWSQKILKTWDPKTDFAPALLHAEHLILLSVVTEVGDIFWQQSLSFPERRPVLEAFLERHETKAQYYNQAIMNTGQKLLKRLEKSAGSAQGTKKPPQKKPEPSQRQPEL